MQEAEDLLVVARQPKVYERLIAVGESEDFPADLQARIAAARQGQSHGVCTHERGKSSELLDAETRSNDLREQVVAAVRWDLRNSAKVMAALAAVNLGSGADDGVQDLFDLAQIVEDNLSAFDQDQSFDVETIATELRAVAKTLSGEISDQRASAASREAKLLRDRAYTHLDDLVVEIRGAARYALRDDPKLLRRFASRYRRLHRSRGNAHDAEASAPTETTAPVGTSQESSG